MPKLGMIGGCSSYDWPMTAQHHITKQGNSATNRVLPQDKITCVSQTQIGGLVQPFADIPAFAEFSSSLVFLLLRGPYLAEAQFDV